MQGQGEQLNCAPTSDSLMSRQVWRFLGEASRCHFDEKNKKPHGRVKPLDTLKLSPKEEGLQATEKQGPQAHYALGQCGQETLHANSLQELEVTLGNNFSVNNHMGHDGRFGERLADETMEDHSKLARTGGAQACPWGKWGGKG